MYEAIFTEFITKLWNSAFNINNILACGIEL
jgi:hypothetical protein